jgi:alpha-glucosidase (family GH31 glycosyl hydrolase)
MSVHSLKLLQLPGERWWGGAAADGCLMPFGQRRHRRDLSTDLGMNQGMPLLISNKGRAVWSEAPFCFTFQDGVLLADGATAPLFAESSPNGLPGIFRQVALAHFPPSGTMPDAALFAAPQYNTWIEMLYEPTQAKILAYAEEILAHDMPAGVLIIDDNWHETYGTFSFHPGRFPRPKELTDRLHDLGFKVTVWVSPFVSPDSGAFRLLERSSYLVRSRDGRIAIREWWNGHSAVLDCTNDGCVTWLHEQLAALMTACGVDGFKFDGGDVDYYRADDVTSRPTSPTGQCAAWAAVGVRYTINEYRAGWKMAGQPLAQRLKDKRRHWGENGLASLIPDGLALGLLGYAYCCPDMIGGGEQIDVEGEAEIDAELFVRYAQCAALFPMMQFSMAPWRVLDATHLEMCRWAARLHVQLGAEIVALAERAAMTGEPIMRHLAYVYPDHGFEDVQDQFMLGDNILAAPVLEQGATTRTVVFPPGTWRGDDGSVVIGPCRQRVAASLARTPLFARAGCDIVLSGLQAGRTHAR